MIVTIRWTPYRKRPRVKSRVQRRVEHWFIIARRRLGAVVAGFGLCATATADLPAPLIRIDSRISRLDKFFQLYNCPQPHHTTEYLRAADGRGLDYRLLPAISVRETLCGVGSSNNNHWGYHPGGRGFSSVEAGIDFIARELAEGFYYKGKTLPQKLFTYNPRAPYPREVLEIMRQIE